MKSRTPAEIINAARPIREARKPAECDNGRLCWVRDPYAAITDNARSPACLGCGGLIRQDVIPSGQKIEKIVCKAPGGA